MIIITGAAGFIGSCLVGKLNEEGYKDLILVDDFTDSKKEHNLSGKIFSAKVNRDDFIPWLRNNQQLVQFIFHIGARTDTTEFDKSIFDRLNLEYSKQVWLNCVEFGLPLVYASSAATYGNGEHGYDDDHENIPLLKPLNPYGDSKQDFDLWALKQERKPYFWAGLKFFNVYGPNEYHKGRMASVIFHAHRQISENGRMKLFKSHRSDFADGMQLRDFIYVKDVVDVCMFLMVNRKNSGIYNLGTGNARSFLDLAKATFSAMDKKEEIEFIDIPEDIREKYQYFTEAKMNKLREAGYKKPFYTIEDGVKDYLSNYLISNNFL
jgi:ADP-L-glycero-D-manno-heptose 6-epimerase